MRVRGLMHCVGCWNAKSIKVAPHAGAWIKTYPLQMPCYWPYESHPMRVRGLKTLITVYYKKEVLQVAPHAGAWIETLCSPSLYLMRCWSHPMRVRGLKLVDTLQDILLL